MDAKTRLEGKGETRDPEDKLRGERMGEATRQARKERGEARDPRDRLRGKRMGDARRLARKER